MLFSTTIFTFAFLPLVLGLYFIIQKPYRNYFVLLASLFFYAWGEPAFVFVMIASIIANYLLALIISKFQAKGKTGKTIVIISIIINLGILFVYKYLNFAIANYNDIFGLSVSQTSIILPIGISFFTFQAMSYVIDVYRKQVDVQKNPFFVGLYISFFPQLIAGPIVRYKTIEQQITDRHITFDGFSEGVRKFIIGFAKKIIIANSFAVVAERAFACGDTISVSLAWLGAISYTIQIFFDFSGYSDMAIGLGKMFGFDFPENFNYPYISKSISEFWRRWHISLGTWFRDYVYFPLGGSRVSHKSRMVFNLLIVWLLTGMWHGANWTFIIWGLMFFVLIVFEKLTGYPERFKTAFTKSIYRVFTLLCIVIGWVIFRSEDFSQSLIYGSAMFGLNNNILFDDLTTFYLNEVFVFAIIAAICSTPFFKVLREKLSHRPLLDRIINLAQAPWYIGLFILSVSYLVVGTHNPFIYFNF